MLEIDISSIYLTNIYQNDGESAKHNYKSSFEL